MCSSIPKSVGTALIDCTSLSYFLVRLVGRVGSLGQMLRIRRHTPSVRPRNVMLSHDSCACLLLPWLIDVHFGCPTISPLDPLNNDSQQAKIIGIRTIEEMFV